MKPQDIIFLIILSILILSRKPKLFVISGLLCFLLSIPLFANWTFFTAQRLVMYGAAFIFVAVLWELFLLVKKK